MKKTFLEWFVFAMMVLLLPSCHQQPVEPARMDYSDMDYWFSCGDESHAADVFYVYPTVSVVSYEDNGASWYADITIPEVRAEANENQLFNMKLYGEYNFYAPYYRQMIFEAYQQPADTLAKLAQFAANDVNDAFQYYMSHFNHGRPFFLMGHSQGSQVLIEMLKHDMTAEQRQQMVAAYCIGYHVTAEELAAYPDALKPATDSLMQGLVIFNSVTDPSAISFISRDDVIGVNPTTWTMDADTMPAEYHHGKAQYNDNLDSVLFVPCPTRTYLYNHTTVCPDLDPEMVFVPAYEEMFPRGNLHFADSWLFGGNVVENMRCRLRNYKK